MKKGKFLHRNPRPYARFRSWCHLTKSHRKGRYRPRHS